MKYFRVVYVFKFTNKSKASQMSHALVSNVNISLESNARGAVNFDNINFQPRVRSRLNFIYSEIVARDKRIIRVITCRRDNFPAM